jgi:polar amino acid transport system substrate-binding protein
MRSISSNGSIPARVTGPDFFLPVACLLALCLLAGSAFAPRARAAQASDHQTAVSALADVQAAIAEIVTADQSGSTDKKFYYRASQRAINALEGAQGPEYVAASGSAGDAAGALGHLDALLDRKATPVWAEPLHGAEANIRAAIAHLADARHAHELWDYDIAVSRALTYLLVARGGPTELGVFGGLDGALANTELGVPDGATIADGCAEPSAPAYGVHDGYIAWVAVAAGEGTHALEENAGEQSIIVRNNMIILPTAAAAVVAKECNSHAAAQPSPASRPIATAAVSSPAKSPVPALYTKAQAAAGAQVFASKCVLCHGANLQGTAAPSVAGTDFLKTAKNNGWTLEVIRYLVFNDMPFNAPASLSPTEYADVLAFLLASDCYPAGGTPFPTADDPAFASVKLGPVPGVHPGENSFGVCPNS